MWELWWVKMLAFPLTWHIIYTTACLVATAQAMTITLTRTTAMLVRAETLVYEVSTMPVSAMMWLSRCISPRKLRQRGGVRRHNILATTEYNATASINQQQCTASTRNNKNQQDWPKLSVGLVENKTGSDIHQKEMMKALPNKHYSRHCKSQEQPKNTWKPYLTLPPRWTGCYICPALEKVTWKTMNKKFKYSWKKWTSSTGHSCIGKSSLQPVF